MFKPRSVWPQIPATLHTELCKCENIQASCSSHPMWDHMTKPNNQLVRGPLCAALWEKTWAMNLKQTRQPSEKKIHWIASFRLCRWATHRTVVPSKWSWRKTPMLKSSRFMQAASCHPNIYLCYSKYTADIQFLSSNSAALGADYWIPLSRKDLSNLSFVWYHSSLLEWT